MPDTNLPQNHNVGHGKPNPSHSSHDSHVAKGQNPLFQLWNPFQNQGLLLWGTQLKQQQQQRQLVIWDFHLSCW